MIFLLYSYSVCTYEIDTLVGFFFVFTGICLYRSYCLDVLFGIVLSTDKFWFWFDLNSGQPILIFDVQRPEKISYVSKTLPRCEHTEFIWHMYLTSKLNWVFTADLGPFLITAVTSGFRVTWPMFLETPCYAEPLGIAHVRLFIGWMPFLTPPTVSLKAVKEIGIPDL